MDPLVEVVRDTVGRHDTFGLACNAKYYEDLGYPGHVNCTDNFNGALVVYEVAKRKGWPALNLFFNTAFTADNVLVSDEPWSRPGDYVLFRAMTDLVCASSACPDDVDPANAWDPTDVHVRVYPAEHRFSTAIAHRVTPESRPVLTKKTGFRSADRGAHAGTSSSTTGYWLPSHFNNEGAIAEYWACREHVAIMDLSPLRKFEVLGPDAETLLQATITRDARRLSVGQVTYTALCNEAGGMIDDGTVFRLGQDNFRFVGGDDYDGVWLREQAERLGLKVWVKPSTDQLHNVAVQGPASRELLRAVVWTPPTQPSLEELGWFRFLVGRVHAPDGIPIVVSRTGYTGELGYEVWCHPDDAEGVWDAIWVAGERARARARSAWTRSTSCGSRPGSSCRGTSSTSRSTRSRPGSASRSTCAATRTSSAAAPSRSARRTPSARSSASSSRATRSAGHGDPVFIGRQEVGVVTSGTRSPVLKKTIALARVAVGFSEPGTALEVGKLDGLQKRIPAHGRPLPLLRPREDAPEVVSGGARRVVHRRAGRVLPSRRLPDRRGGSDLRAGARSPARAVPPAVRRRVRDRDPARTR